jgi:hypothetical protein
MAEFNITTDDGEEFFEESVGVSEVTPLASLKDRRNQILNDLYLDVKVPRWNDPEIFVRFKPVSASRLNKVLEKRRKAGGEDWAILANADMMIDSCIGVYAVMDGDRDTKLSLRPGDPKGEWTKFDADLGAALGVEQKLATATVRALFLTEGDLIEASNQLFAWSGISAQEADEAF